MDYRDYIEILRQEGLLLEIEEEVSWNLEAPCISAMNYRVENGQKSHVFNNVKGYEGKGRLLGSPFASPKKQAWERASIIFGLPKDTPWNVFRDEFIRRLGHPLKPIVVEAGDATCKQNIVMGKDVNLFDFPWPFIHQSDGGRYGTLQTHIIEDPDTGWVNWGNYRMMIVKKNLMTALMVPVQHGPGIFYAKYEARGNPAPFVYAVGGDPIINFAAGTTLPSGVCEADYAGGFRQEPMKVVRAETNKLYVPADAEIIIEGVMLPNEKLDEGPQGEYTGYVHGRAPMPVMQIHCITYRDDPIIPYVVGGNTFSDEQALCQAMSPVEVYRNLHEAGFPVTNVRFLTELLWDGLVISTDVPYAGYVNDLRAYIESHKIDLWGNQRIIVDSDVNIEDEDTMYRIYQEMGTRIDPQRDILRGDADVLATPLTPLVNAEGRQKGIGQVNLTWDCTTPLNWKTGDKKQTVEFKNLYPDNLRDRSKNIFDNL